MFCIQCGNRAEITDVHCARCGVRIHTETGTPTTLPHSEADTRHGRWASILPVVVFGVMVLVVAVLGLRRSTSQTEVTPTASAPREDSSQSGATNGIRVRALEEIIADNNMPNGISAFEEQRYEDALYYFAKELSLDPSNETAAYYAGHSHMKLGHPPTAAGYFRRFLALASMTDTRRGAVVEWLQNYSGPEENLENGVAHLDELSVVRREKQGPSSKR
jgi:hypothetical protein